MRIIPKTASQRITFARAHVPVWAEDPAAIGLTAEDVAEVAAALDAASAARDAAEALRQQARAATLAADVLDADLSRTLAVAIDRIKIAARRAHSGQGAGGGGRRGGGGDAGIRVLALAQLPVPGANPDEPRLTEPPLAPRNVRVAVSATGEATITWSTGAGGERGARLGRQQRGRTDVQYLVERYQTPPTPTPTPTTPTTPTFLGITSTPRFVDAAPLPGQSAYTIRAVRGDRVSAATMAALTLPTRSTTQAARAA